jgi:hypothetical protein
MRAERIKRKGCWPSFGRKKGFSNGRKKVPLDEKKKGSAPR